jgi:hypothetical protein
MAELKRPVLTFVLIFLSPVALIGAIDMYLWITLTYLTTSTIHSREVVRVTSPDRKVDAVVVKVEGGLSTTNDPYNLYIVPTGGKVAGRRASLNGLNMTDLKFFWKKPKSLAIEYKDGVIEHFEDSWSSNQVESGRYVVELRLLHSSTSEQNK